MRKTKPVLNLFSRAFATASLAMLATGCNWFDSHPTEQAVNVKARPTVNTQTGKSEGILVPGGTYVGLDGVKITDKNEINKPITIVIERINLSSILTDNDIWWNTKPETPLYKIYPKDFESDDVINPYLASTIRVAIPANDIIGKDLHRIIGGDSIPDDVELNAGESIFHTIRDNEFEYSDGYLVSSLYLYETYITYGSSDKPVNYIH